VILCEKDSFKINEQRYEKADLEQISYQWNALLNASVQKLPTDWMEPIFSKSLEI